MFTLVPNWVNYYEEFQNSILKRNLWFIYLRYGAVIMLTAMLLGTEYVMKLQLNRIQLTAIITTTLVILTYNLLFHYLGKKTGFTIGRLCGLHFSLFQMILDLIFLTLLVHFMGGIENPLYLFYIFHLIIGSLILPGILVYAIAFAIIITISGLFYLEYSRVIPHHAIEGLLEYSFYDRLNYLIIFLLVFSLMIFISVVIANKIARELYLREKDLYESLKRIRETEAAKEKYVMGVVHEIKTPISAVQTFLDLIIGQYLGPINEEVINRLNKARGRTEEAIKMINNVLYISKLKLLDEIQKDDIDLAALAETTICNQKIQAEAKSTSLSLINGLTSGKKIRGDKALLELALSNLISNAIKYSGFYGIIEITLNEDEKNQYVEVCDNGIGIPENEINNIFKEFYRASNIKQKYYEGAGLGLSVVHQIIKSHGGTIRVQSPSRLGDESRPGTCFTIIFPIQLM